MFAPVARIQVQNPSNFIVFRDKLLKKQILFCGTLRIHAFLDKHFPSFDMSRSSAENSKKRKRSNTKSESSVCSKKPILVVSGNKMGKTTTAQCMAHMLMINYQTCNRAQKQPKMEARATCRKRQFYVNMKELVDERLGECVSSRISYLHRILSRAVNFGEDPTHCTLPCCDALKEGLRSLKHLYEHVIIVLDNIEHLFYGMINHQAIEQLSLSLQSIFTDTSSPCQFIVTTTTCLAIPLFHFSSTTLLRDPSQPEIRKLAKSFLMLEVPSVSSEADLRDTELLLRHYLPIHKHKLKEILSYLKELRLPVSCALLSSIVEKVCMDEKRNRTDGGAEEDVVQAGEGEDGLPYRAFFSVAQSCSSIVDTHLEEILQSTHEGVQFLVACCQSSSSPYLQMLLLLASVGCPTRPKGFLWSALTERRRGDASVACLKDPYLQTILQFYLEQPKVDEESVWVLKDFDDAAAAPCMDMTSAAATLPSCVNLLRHVIHTNRPKE